MVSHSHAGMHPGVHVGEEPSWTTQSRVHHAAAAERLGFSFEGIFRQHWVYNDRNRDTAWYSMVDTEWAATCHAFEEWLDPSNFDNRGVQRIRLRGAMRQIASGPG